MRPPNRKDSHIIPAVALVKPNTDEFFWYIPPTGYLLGIAVNPISSYGELRCQIIEYNGQPVENTEFFVQMAMTSGGIVFTKILENANAAYPYKLKITRYNETSPPIPEKIGIYPIGCWESF